ncbi:MAG: hypothetical protein KC731_16225 [Myxococcales bacterium]|nr:hypothetical protein [Myxococcales bacterium]
MSSMIIRADQVTALQIAHYQRLYTELRDGLVEELGEGEGDWVSRAVQFAADVGVEDRESVHRLVDVFSRIHRARVSATPVRAVVVEGILRTLCQSRALDARLSFIERHLLPHLA